MAEFIFDVVLELFWWALSHGYDRRRERRRRRRARKAAKASHD